MRFGKLRADGRSHVVVNNIDAVEADWKRLAAQVCGDACGLFAHRLVVLSHRGRANFDLWCFDRDGEPGEAEAPEVACAARSIHRRYGYRRALLRCGGRTHLAEITGETVAVRPWRGHDPRGPTRVHVAYLFEGELSR